MLYFFTFQKHCQFAIDPSETPVALKTGLQVDRQNKQGNQSDIHDVNMEDSLEISSSAKGAEGYVI